MNSINGIIVEARRLIGKDICPHGVVGRVKSISIHDSLDNLDVDWDHNAREKAAKMVKNFGCIIILEGKWSENSRMKRLFWPGVNDAKAIESIKVNGYEAIENGEYYSFGCAKITKESLRVARTCLQTIEKEGNITTCKDSGCVKIGAGYFTLDILKKLNLD